MVITSEFRTRRQRVARGIKVALGGAVLVACFLAASHFDYRDAMDAALAAPPVLVDAGCRLPAEGEVVHVRRLRADQGEGAGFLCTYYNNAGYGRKSRVDRREITRAIRTARAG